MVAFSVITLLRFSPGVVMHDGFVDIVNVKKAGQVKISNISYYISQ